VLSAQHRSREAPALVKAVALATPPTGAEAITSLREIAHQPRSAGAPPGGRAGLSPSQPLVERLIPVAQPQPAALARPISRSFAPAKFE